MQYTRENLVLHPYTDPDPRIINSTNPDQAGWKYIHFQASRLSQGQTWSFGSGNCECALVVWSGAINASSNYGQWNDLGHRLNVFAGLPEALYLPRQTNLTVQAQTDCQFALAWAPAQNLHPARRIRPEDITVEIRGGDNVTRQINRIIPPGFDCDRLVVVEVYTPGGNWSSYPPHKHDVHRLDSEGKLLEADLEEIYYYKIDPPDGYAFQRVYTGETSPLAQVGTPFDEVLMLRNDDLALIPEGYHPVTSAPGYTTYYLNVLAGSAQSLAAADDPRYSWVKNTFQTKDRRVPIYPVEPGQMA